MANKETDEGPFGPTAEDVAAATAAAMQRTQSAFVNLTPHAVTLVTPDGAITWPPSGQVARVSTEVESVGCAGLAPLRVEQPGPVTGLPEPQRGTWLIVSAQVRTACPDRLDLVSPGALVRDGAGQVVGCEAFIVNPSERWGE